MDFKVLATDFKKAHFQFTQVKREGDVAIYKKHAIPFVSRPKAFSGGYEVIIITRHEGYAYAGVAFEPAEVYPSSEQWGSKGWTEKTLSGAEICFERVKQMLEEKSKN